MRLPMSTVVLAFLAAAGHAAPPNVVTDTSISGALVWQVMGDLGQPQVLLPAGASVHHHQMRPSDAQALQASDLLVWFGPELTPWIERAATTRGAEAANLELLHVEGITLRGYDDAGEGAEKHDQDQHGQEQEHHGEAEAVDGHDHGTTDPHAWLNPSNAGPWLQSIAAQLSELDPQNAEVYAANAKAAIQAYAALDARISQQLAPLKDRSFVVFHDAYGYFTQHYGLRSAIAVSLGDATSPSAARLNLVREKIAQSGASCAFPEHAHDPRLIETAIEGTDAATGASLDPAGATLNPGPDLYRDTLQALADALTDCLSRS